MSNMKTKSLTRVIELPFAGAADRLSIDADGTVRLYDHSGGLVTPVSDERSMSYVRAKGPKFQSRSVSRNGYASTSGLEELARLDSLFAIDTNTKDIGGVRVSVAFFIQCGLVPTKSGYRCVVLEDSAHAFEFHDVPGNPEMLSILMIAKANEWRLEGRKSPGIGVITDSELGNHVAYTRQEIPIYQHHYLPVGFSLIYASADTGQEFTNRLIKQCNFHSDKHLKELAQAPLTNDGFLATPISQDILYRYRKYPVLERDLGLAAETTINEGSQYIVRFDE